MEEKGPIEYKRIGFQLSNFWINFLFHFTYLTFFMSFYSFVVGEDKQFVPFRILYSLLWAWLIPIVKNEKQ